MSSRKEINPFSIAFLDLMSSALAAVIILFVIVPKSDIQIDLAEASFDEMNTGFEEVDSIIRSWAQYMSEQEIALLIAKTDQLKDNLLEIQESAQLTQVRLDEAKRHNDQLTMRLNLTEKKLAQYQKEKEEAKPKQVASKPTTPSIAAQKSEQSEKREASQPVQESTVKTPVTESKQFDTDGKGDFFFGLDAPLVTMISWDDPKYEITLHLKDDRGILCDYYSRKTSFGQWVKIPRKFQSSPNQAIIQNELVPGTYEVHAHMRKPRSGANINISGFVAITPPNGKSKKIDFGVISVAPGAPPHKSGAQTKIGTIVVTDSDVRWTKA